MSVVAVTSVTLKQLLVFKDMFLLDLNKSLKVTGRGRMKASLREGLKTGCERKLKSRELHLYSTQALKALYKHCTNEALGNQWGRFSW